MDLGTSLDGVTVVEQGSTVTAPYATQCLGAMGAEVIKVEPPGGDGFRDSGAKTESGLSGYFAACNCGKRSIRLDLKDPDGRDAFLDLVADADVVVENFRPGTADRLGVGYDDVRTENDAIVYCSISAYGDDGPLRDRAGFDPIIQARTGLMSVTGERDGPPVRMGVAAVDLMTGLWGAATVMAALHGRERTGEGTYIDLGMFDVGISMLTKHAARYFLTGADSVRMGTEDVWAAPYGAYPTGDDELVMIAAHRQGFWERLCDVLGLDWMADDPRYASRDDRIEHREEINGILREAFRERNRDEWIETLEGEIPVGPVASVAEALDDEQTAARELRAELSHPTYGTIPVLNLPIHTAEGRHRFGTPPPELGEHSREILRDAGVSPDRIDALEADGVI